MLTEYGINYFTEDPGIGWTPYTYAMYQRDRFIGENTKLFTSERDYLYLLHRWNMQNPTAYHYVPTKIN